MLALREYQHIMIDHILDHPRCNLFAPMGVGKTVSTATAIDYLSLVHEVFPVLILAPMRVAVSVWPEEIKKWPHLRHLRVSVVIGTADERRIALLKPAEIYCMNFENIPWLDGEVNGGWPFKLVVVDECSKIKGFRLRQGTKRAQVLGKHIHNIPFYIGLTGTPASNGLQDLWAIQWMVDKGERLGRSFDAFKSRWFRSIQVGADRFAVKLEPMPHAQAEIQERLSDICLSLDAKDWFDIREPIVNVIKVDLPPAARKLYRAMEKEMYIALLSGREVEAFNAASKTMKCLQIASGSIIHSENGDWEAVHDAKLEALDDVIEEATGMPVLVAYHFRADLARLLKAFPQGRAFDHKPQTLIDWNAGKIPVLFASASSAGHGLNLQDGGNIIAFYSFNWNLEERMQIIERIGPVRQKQAGYDRPVFIHYIVARDTMDELVMQQVESKRAVQDILLDALKRREVK